MITQPKLYLVAFLSVLLSSSVWAGSRKGNGGSEVTFQLEATRADLVATLASLKDDNNSDAELLAALKADLVVDPEKVARCVALINETRDQILELHTKKNKVALAAIVLDAKNEKLFSLQQTEGDFVAVTAHTDKDVESPIYFDASKLRQATPRMNMQLVYELSLIKVLEMESDKEISSAAANALYRVGLKKGIISSNEKK